VTSVSVPDQVDGLATAGGEVWALSSAARAVLRIDPATTEIRDRISLAGDVASGPEKLSISAGTDFIWVLNGDAATVVKIDPSLHDVVETYRLPAGRGSLALAAGEGAAWISNGFDGTITRIDEHTSEVASIAVSAYSSPKGVTVAGGLVWVSVADDRSPQ
jgi:streptogramin lyase